MLINLGKSTSTCYAGIRGTGYYVPERVVTNKELEQCVDTTDEWIQQKTGIKERRIAAEDEATSDLAYKASLMAIEAAGITPADIDLIILNCVCPDHMDPATSCLLQARLGALNASAFDIHVGGCPGTVYALNIGTSFVTSGSCRNVLVVGADVNTSILDWKDRVTCCFFGDGAGAVVLGRSSRPGILGFSMYADGRGYETITIPHGGTRIRRENTSINTGLRDGPSSLHMDGKAVWNFAVDAFPDSIRELASETGISLSDIDIVIPHQANINIIKESMKRLDIPLEKAVTNLDKYGNTAAASVFIALAEAVREGRVVPQSKVALSAFGAGLAWGAAILDWNNDEDFL